MNRANIIGATLIALLLALVTTEVLAQSRTIYGSDGKVIGRERTNSNGSTTLYDSSGRVKGRTSTSGNTTTLYSADGRRIGTTTKNKPQGK